MFKFVILEINCPAFLRISLETELLVFIELSPAKFRNPLLKRRLPALELGVFFGVTLALSLVASAGGFPVTGGVSAAHSFSNRFRIQVVAESVGLDFHVSILDLFEDARVVFVLVREFYVESGFVAFPLSVVPES